MYSPALNAGLMDNDAERHCRQQDPNSMETIKIIAINVYSEERLRDSEEQHLIKEQAGFRAGKSYTSQLLNLTQHIEDGYQECKIICCIRYSEP